MKEDRCVVVFQTTKVMPLAHDKHLPVLESIQGLALSTGGGEDLECTPCVSGSSYCQLDAA